MNNLFNFNGNYQHLQLMRSTKESDIFANPNQNIEMNPISPSLLIDQASSSSSPPNQKQGKNLTKLMEKNNNKKQKVSADEKYKHDQWNYSQIKKIFMLYAEYGSQWKIIQTQFPQRSSNSIKNRFYTVVRTFLKILFRQHPNIQNKLPHEIPSKIILKFFQGRDQFTKFKGFGKKIMKAINYDLQSQLIKQIVLDNADDILILFALVFPEEQAQKSGKSRIMNRRIKKRSSQVKLKQQQRDNQPNVESQNKAQLKTQTSYQAPQASFQASLPVPQMYFQVQNMPDVYQNQQQGMGAQGYYQNFYLMPNNGLMGMMGYRFMPPF